MTTLIPQTKFPCPIKHHVYKGAEGCRDSAERRYANFSLYFPSAYKITDDLLRDYFPAHHYPEVLSCLILYLTPASPFIIIDGLVVAFFVETKARINRFDFCGKIEEGNIIFLRKSPIILLSRLSIYVIPLVKGSFGRF